MQMRIENCHLLNASKAKVVDVNGTDAKIDSKETIEQLLQFILDDTYAKDWKKAKQMKSSFVWKKDGAEKSIQLIPASPDLFVFVVTVVVMLVSVALYVHGSSTVRWFGAFLFVVLFIFQMVLYSYIFWRVLGIERNVEHENLLKKKE